MPTGVRFDEQVLESEDGEFAEITQTVVWDAPLTEGVEVQVHGVTACVSMPAEPSPGTAGPCLVVRTSLPASVRTLLATAPASAGSASWSWTEQTGCNIGMKYPSEGPAYHAVVIAAYNQAGHSIFAIAAPGGWYMAEPDEVIC
jgi:hypothetical protein